MLTDAFGRIHDYLRISVTDVCNLPCSYCMPQEDHVFTPASRLKQAQEIPHDTAKKYMVPGHRGTFAFITTITEPFCGDCNRLRLTADGKMKNCLFSADETDILGAF